MKRNNKAIVITVCSFVLIVAILVAVLAILGGNKKDDPVDSGVTTSPYVNQMVETTAQSAPVATTASTSAGVLTEDMANQINAYLSGTYCISTVMVDSTGAETPIDMAISGKNLQADMDVNGMQLSVLILDGDMYLVDVPNKKYVSLSSAMMSMFGMSMDDLEKEFEAIDFSNFKVTGNNAYETTLNGQKAVCCECFNEEAVVSFYFVDGKLSQIDNGPVGGAPESTMKVLSFTPYIPSGMLTLTGYTKTNLMGIMSF